VGGKKILTKTPLLQVETARLYKNAGINPLAGCLPTLATIPVFIGLYRALTKAADEGLLTSGFFWIPSLAGPSSLAARQAVSAGHGGGQEALLRVGYQEALLRVG
jgi:membrane protein insertase Oxa1/YidC/SpoIIIJ